MNKLTSKLLIVAVFILSVSNIQRVFAQTKTVAQWVALAKTGQKNLKSANFTGADLQNIDLNGVDLSNANLTGANFTNANLSKAKLEQCNLTGVNFTNANLTKADFLATNMVYVNLKNANLTQALLQEANLSYSILNGANLTSANLILTDLSNADLWNATLTNAIISYDATVTATSSTSYEGTESKPSTTNNQIPAPEIVETEALGTALEKYEQNKSGFVKLTATRINGNTKGIDFAWAKKNGAFISTKVVTAPK